MPLFQLVRLYRRMRAKRHVGLAAVLLLLLIAVLGNSICFYVFDGPAYAKEGTPLTFGDAIWYSLISMTTIGYGDYYATSTGARIGTVLFVVILGLGTFSFVVGIGIDTLSELASKRRRGMSRAHARDHVLIVNVPSASRLSQLVGELRSDPHHAKCDVVVVSDQIDELPIRDEQVLFVRGSVLERETYERADVATAAMAIVLATSYDDATSDAVVASAVAVIDSMNSAVNIVAECINPKHKQLFDSVRCDSIVFSMGISGNLLVQEAQDPGIAQLMEVVTSNTQGTTLFSTEVPEAGAKQSYADFARDLLDRDINLLCVNRGEESLTAFKGVMPHPGDRLIYAASGRLTWNALAGYDS